MYIRVIKLVLNKENVNRSSSDVTVLFCCNPEGPTQGCFTTEQHPPLVLKFFRQGLAKLARLAFNL